MVVTLLALRCAWWLVGRLLLLPLPLLPLLHPREARQLDALSLLRARCGLRLSMDLLELSGILTSERQELRLCAQPSEHERTGEGSGCTHRQRGGGGHAISS